MPDQPSAFPTDAVVRRTAERLLLGWLESPPSHELWEIARVLAEVADEVNRPDIPCDVDSPEVAAVQAEVRNLLDDLRRYVEFGPVPTPKAFAAAVRALEVQRERADQAEWTLRMILRAAITDEEIPRRLEVRGAVPDEALPALDGPIGSGLMPDDWAGKVDLAQAAREMGAKQREEKPATLRTWGRQR